GRLLPPAPAQLPLPPLARLSRPNLRQPMPTGARRPWSQPATQASEHSQSCDAFPFSLYEPSGAATYQNPTPTMLPPPPPPPPIWRTGAVRASWLTRGCGLDSSRLARWRLGFASSARWRLGFASSARWRLGFASSARWRLGFASSAR